MCDHAAEVVQVVADLRRGARLSADRENELALVVRFYDVIQRVVLEYHRRRLASEEMLRERRVFHAAPAEVYCQLGLDADIYLEIRCTVGGDHRAEISQKMSPQRFRHSFAPDDQVHLVLAEVDPSFVDERFDERRVPENQIAV